MTRYRWEHNAQPYDKTTTEWRAYGPDGLVFTVRLPFGGIPPEAFKLAMESTFQSGVDNGVEMGKANMRYEIRELLGIPQGDAS